MVRVQYVGPPVTNWYGRDLTTGDILEVPAAKVSPLFVPVDSEGEAPRRRGRPRKADADPS